MLFVTSFFARFSDGNRTSRWQNSSDKSASLGCLQFLALPRMFPFLTWSVSWSLNLWLRTTASTNSGIGKILLSLKYFPYFWTLSLSWSVSVFFFFFVIATTRTLALPVVFKRVVLCWSMKRVINLSASGKVLCHETYLVKSLKSMRLKSAPP